MNSTTFLVILIVVLFIIFASYVGYMAFKFFKEEMEYKIEIKNLIKKQQELQIKIEKNLEEINKITLDEYVFPTQINLLGYSLNLTEPNQDTSKRCFLYSAEEPDCPLQEIIIKKYGFQNEIFFSTQFFIGEVHFEIKTSPEKITLGMVMGVLSFHLSQLETLMDTINASSLSNPVTSVTLKEHLDCKDLLDNWPKSTH